MQGILIPENAGESMVIISVVPGYEGIAATIGGECRYIERVRTRLTQPHLGNLVLAVDEVGLYHSWGRNSRASALYAPGVFPGIHGPAIVFRETAGFDGADFIDVLPGDLSVISEYLMQVARLTLCDVTHTWEVP